MNENIAEKNNQIIAKEQNDVDKKIQQFEQENNYEALGGLAYDFYLKEDKANLTKCVKALIEANKNEKNIPYCLTCYLAGEVSCINKKYETAKKDYYLAIKNAKTDDIDWVEKSYCRLEDVCLKSGDLEFLECFYKDYKNDRCYFVEKNTNKIHSFKMDLLLMWEVKPNDLVQLTICHITEKTKLVTKVKVLKKAKEVSEEVFVTKLNTAIQKEIVLSKEKNEMISIMPKKLKAYEGDLPYIFVSYSHKENEIVLPMIEYFQKEGFRVWFDQGIEAGSEWPQYIGEHLDGSACVLICMSEYAENSVNCRNEINLAVALNKDMIVVHLDDHQMSLGMRLQIGSKQAIFRNRHTSFASFMEELCVAKLLQKCR